MLQKRQKNESTSPKHRFHPSKALFLLCENAALSKQELYS